MDQKEFNNQSYDQEEVSQIDISLFVKIGIIVLSILAVIGLSVRFLPNAITVSNISSKRDLPIYCVDTEEKKVAISFDTAWGNEDIQDILDILDQYKVKTTFFMTGEWVEQYPESVQLIVEAGHDLANHSENHKQMTQLSKQQCVDEIMTVHKRVKELTGIEMNLFRAPYGDYNNMVVGTARDCKYYTIQWDIDSNDWKDYGVDSIISNTVDNKKLENGSIILMHNGTKFTVDALKGVITGLQEKGYVIVPVSELIHTGDYLIDKTGKQVAK